MRPSRSRPPQRNPRNQASNSGIRWFVVATVVLFFILLSNREFLEDRFNWIPEPPSAEIEQLAQATTMTPLGQRLFYRQDPSIEPRSNFLDQCEAPEQTIVLGCYLQENLGNRILRSKIIIQQVDDPQFQGIMEVTAAHEMLHAAYNRLRPAEQAQLARHLKTAAARVTEPRLLKLLKRYETESEILYHNELHSHLGTELGDLADPVLEMHYQQYFRDRQQVVALAQKSGQVLTQMEQQSEALKAELEQLEAELEQSKNKIEQIEAQLNRSAQRLDRLQNQLTQTKTSAEAAVRTNSFSADRLVRQFERERATYNRQVSDHNRDVQQQIDRVDRFNQSVQTYRAKVGTYNQIAQENRAVLESLQGKIPPREATVAPEG